MKFRSDFVTNSSSSSFVACGVLSSELAEFIVELLGGKTSSYAPHQVGSLEVDGNVVSVTTTLDSGDYSIFYKTIDDYDVRTEKQKIDDNKKANTPQQIASTLAAFLPRLTADQKNRLAQLLTEAAERGNTAATVYVDQTDGFESQHFSEWDFSSGDAVQRTRQQPGACFSKSSDPAYAQIIRAEMEDDWMAEYGYLVTEDPYIEFEGKLFVFTGFGHYGEKEHPIVQQVIAEGGQYRSKISGITDYLVVDPADAGESKINSVIKQRDKGKYIQVILRKDLEKALGMAVETDEKDEPSAWEEGVAYDDTVSFILPDDYELLREYDDEGDESIKIVGEFYVDEDWERQHNLICGINEIVVDRSKAPRPVIETIQDIYKDSENIRVLHCQTKPESIFSSIGTSVLIFGREIKMMAASMIIPVSDDKALLFVNNGVYNEDEPEESVPQFEKLLKVARAIRIKGKPMILGDLNAHSLMNALKPSYDGNEPIDTGFKISINVNGGGESTTYEYGSGSIEPTITKVSLTHVTPDEKLHPHYSSKKYGPASMLGVNVVVNANGTEYAFKSLRKELECASSDPDEGLSETYRAVYRRIVDADHAEYTLDQRAKEMIPLFRVDPSVFDKKHDRECELAEGYMHRAYMMSALRSFAWSLSDWCRQKNVQPEDLSYADLRYIISFVSGHGWLNYDADTYCEGLCGCQDLHVYYVPDNTSYTDKQALLPDAEHTAQIEALKKRFPNFNEISTQVHSLDALREDLAYIQPAIETIYDALAEERDREEPLTGDEADILYAWCALAMAASGPFFTEDGPTNCWFNQRTDAISAPQAKKEQKVGNTSAAPIVKRADSEDCRISISGILEKYDGDDTAIILPDGINAIGTDAFLFNKTIKTVVIPEGVETIESDAFWSCNALEEVVLPASLRTIESNAFRSCKALRAIIIPEGTREIGDDVFTGCKELQDIYLPKSVRTIGDDAFYTFNDQTVIHVPKDSDAARYAEKHDLKFDHKKPPKQKSVRVDVKTSPKQSQNQTGNVENASSGRESTPDEYKVLPDGTLYEYNGNKRDIVLPDGITTIMRSAFKEKNPETIICPKSLKKISSFAFWDCKTLTEIQLNEDIEEIGSSIFWRCEKLKSIYLPEKLLNVGSGAFSQCTNLESATIAAPIEKLPKSSFFKCEKLSTVELPESIKEIGTDAFSLCRSLGNITLPKKLNRIEESAFFSCEQLREIVIPIGVTSIEEKTFSGCKSLNSIHISPFVRNIAQDAFENIPESAVFHVIKGSYAERYCQENNYSYDYKLDPEQLRILQAIVRRRKAEAEARQREEAEKKAQEEARRRAEEEQRIQEEQRLQNLRDRYQKFVRAIQLQKRIVSQNQGWFGTEAKNRKEAQEKIARLQEQLAKEFPNGKP